MSDPRPMARQLADDIRKILQEDAPRYEWTGEELVKLGWRKVSGVVRAAPREPSPQILIAHRWVATQTWADDDAKVYCGCGALLVGKTEIEAQRAWAEHVLRALGVGGERAAGEGP